MEKKKSGFKLGIIAGAIFGISGIIYGYGAGRALTFNPLEIYRIWEARQFEKRLAGQINNGRTFYRPLRITLDHALAYNQIFGEKGLAEFNKQEGMQADEYNLAIQKITGKNVGIRQGDIRNRYGLEVVNALIFSRPLDKLEDAAMNWNSDNEKPRD